MILDVHKLIPESNTASFRYEGNFGTEMAAHLRRITPKYSKTIDGL